MEEKQRSNEWYTPSKYIEAAREVMGGIDLDPASCELANKTVKATRYYSIEDDGLCKPWYGRMWLNPPYGLVKPTGRGSYKGGGYSAKNKSLQVQFIHKAIEEYETGHIEQAILLITANISLPWFQPLWDYPMCCPKQKIRFFVLGMTERQRQVFGNVFVYLGPHEHKFVDTFSQFGRIAKAIDIPRRVEKPIPLWDAELSAAQVANHYQVGSLGI